MIKIKNQTYSLVSVILVSGASGCITGPLFGGEEALEPCLDDKRLEKPFTCAVPSGGIRKLFNVGMWSSSAVYGNK